MVLLGHDGGRVSGAPSNVSRHLSCFKDDSGVPALANDFDVNGTSRSGAFVILE